MSSSSTSDQLSKHHCVPCEGGVEPLSRAEFTPYLPQVTEWSLENYDKQLCRVFVRKNFKDAIAFINHIAEIAEAEGHHPDILLKDYKKVQVMLSTHAIGGLSINDFVMAVKIDELLNKQSV